MQTKVDAPVLVPEGRSILLREIFGIFIALIAILVLLALLSPRSMPNWIGPVGARVAAQLVLVVGGYVAFAVPFMLGTSAFHLLRRETGRPRPMRSWLRGLGGLLLLVTACALLTLSAPVATGDAVGTAFERGGVVGNFLIDDRGLRLRSLLGQTGALLVFGALTLIGLVLFTERLLIDIARLAWAGLMGAASLLGDMAWAHRAGQALRSALVEPVASFFHRIMHFKLLVRFIEYMRGVQFQRDGYRRVIPSGPIVELGAPEVSETPGDPRLSRPDGRGATILPRRAVHIPESDHSAEPASKTNVAMERIEHPMAPPAERRPRKPLAVQPEMELFPSEYQLPPLGLLADPPAERYIMSDDEKERLSRKIEQTLEQFKVEVQVIEVIQGPVITRFALKVAPGVRVNRILALDSELAMALKAPHVRILAPIPGQSAVGIEVPNKRSNPVLLKEILDSDAFRKSRSPLTIGLGHNIAGEPIVCDLAQMPHLLIAGATGSGKSVCLNTIIASLLYRNRPNQVKFVMIDPKRVELSIYQAIPHLIAPVVSETRKAAAALAWCVEQMEERYRRLAEVGVRNIDGYNALAAGVTTSRKAEGIELSFMPHIVIFIDELADLMMVARNEVEEYIIRLAQMARAVGMHLVLATQRPSVNVITGIIKANFPSRIAFQVSSKVDSRTILDMNGAEALLGRGDMLYSPGGVKPFRIQGAYVADGEVERLADYIRDQEHARYEKEDFEVKPTPAERAKAQLQVEEEEAGWSDETDGASPVFADGMPVRGRAGEAPLTPADMDSLSDTDLYNMALRLILESRKASVSYIQRRMKIGYARAGRIMDLLEEQGIVGPYQGSKPRDLLVDPAEYMQSLEAEE